mmetsp:Transcript_67542/g.170433  ORF Transcript_67542/g.170433 Transcript_67542/m.170433 type:complete len:214 (-) Transcript_67542:88-729(-)
MKRGWPWAAWLALLLVASCHVPPAAGVCTASALGGMASGRVAVDCWHRASAAFLEAQRPSTPSWLQHGSLSTTTRTAETVIVVILLAFAAFGLVGLLALFNHHWSQQATEQDVKQGFVAVSSPQGMSGYPGSMGQLPGDSMRSLTAGSVPGYPRGGPGGAPFGPGGPPAPPPPAPPPPAGGRSSPFETAPGPGGSFGSLPPSATTPRSKKTCC